MDDGPVNTDDKSTGGLECPTCGCRHFYTINTLRCSRRVMRRKQCRHCGRIVRTSERIFEAN